MRAMQKAIATLLDSAKAFLTVADPASVCLCTKEIIYVTVNPKAQSSTEQFGFFTRL